MNSRSHDIETLYAAERPRLERTLRRKVRSRDAALDLIQDMFLRIWERTSDTTGNASAFLTRCARNAAIDHLRSESRRERLQEGTLPSQYAASPATPFEILSARQNLQSLQDRIAALPRQTRHIFLLNRIHGHSFVEIAATLGISERAVAKHMARALAACTASDGAYPDRA
ncbi:RNA polymerase sigma factor [Labrys sp. 22185]|uniref:RNA polymerase sigma factor n=1 Tax=Labrys sp. 22185 TaxID=3453888 RepID=UPI003F85BBEE